MKTSSFAPFIFFAAVCGSLFAGRAIAETLDAANSAPKTPVHSCCAAMGKNTAPAAISDRSLYQLDATWTDDAGSRVTLASLRGRPVVVAMFFAHCSYACPVLVTDMLRIRDSLSPQERAVTQFVLVSFDPDRDSPAELRAYRERMQLDPQHWTLLHGDAGDVQELAMLLGVKYRRDANGDFSHSNLITVLNAEGEVSHQRSGLNGDVATAVRAVSLAAK